jgi:hypothetical protein
MVAHRGKFVAYFRVSTDRQGKSGLGLEAQRKAVLDYLNGGSWQLVQEFVEVEMAAVRANARQFAVNVLPIIEEIERAGITSHNAIAAKLNERNVRTARGGKWTHVQVGAVLRPFEQSAAVAVV